MLCLSHAPLAIVSGTRSTAFSGKSSLIPALFSSPQSNGAGRVVQSVNKSRLNANKNNVDVLIGDSATYPANHTPPPWTIVDFHASVESEPARRLLKACAAHATLHIVHASAASDFGAVGDGCRGAMSYELVDLLDHYAAIYPSGTASSCPPPTRLIVLLRDVACSSQADSEYDMLDDDEVKEDDANLLMQRIEQALLQRYPWAADCIKLVRFESSTTNNNNDEEHLFRQKQLASEVNALIGQVLTRNKGWKSLRSMNEVRRTFETLTSAGNNGSVARMSTTTNSDKFNMELEFDRLFEQIGAGAVATIDVERMFPLAYKNRELNECKERLGRVGYDTREGDEAVRHLARLKDERLRLQPLSPHVMFFVRLLLRHSSNNNSSSSSSNGTNRSAKRSQCGDDDDGGELAPWTSQSSFIGDVNEFETLLVQWKSGPLKLLKQER